MSARPGILLAFAALSAWTAGAAPTRAELLKAETDVRAATAELLDGLARGERTRDEVAEAVRIMASQTAEPAEEYLFLQGAFRLFVRAGEYVRAVDVLRRMQRREFPPEALADLVGRALEPVPRGTDVGELEPLLDALREESVQRRRQAAARRIGRALAETRPPAFAVAEGESLPDVLVRIRRQVRSAGGPGFGLFLRVPLAADGSEGFPALPALQVADTPLADVLARGVRAGAFRMRAQGDRLFFACPAGAASTVSGADLSAGDGEATARRLKRIRIRFAAFGADEALDAAVERLLLAVADEAQDVDVLLRAAPDGTFPRMGTLRVSDTTLFDLLGLAAESVGYRFDVRGTCLVLRPAPAGE